MLIYHGSVELIEQPEYGKGKPQNDYGLGFYCTKEIEMAKEWSCTAEHDGYANTYDIDVTDLKILNLNSSDYTILHWLSVLIKNRTFRITNPIAKDARDYLLANFPVDVQAYDIVVGYRADDSYFSFAEDFLNNAISVNKLSAAMRLGNLGEQVVLISKKAFSRLKFVDAVKVERSKYFVLRNKRDRAARAEYLSSNRKPNYGSNELYVLDIMRQGVKSDDPRLR